VKFPQPLCRKYSLADINPFKKECADLVFTAEQDLYDFLSSLTSQRFAEK